MFLHLSVILFTGWCLPLVPGWGCLPHPPANQRPTPPWQTPPGQCMLGYGQQAKSMQPTGIHSFLFLCSLGKIIPNNKFAPLGKPWSHYFLCVQHYQQFFSHALKTRMHSSRMRTIRNSSRLLPVIVCLLLGGCLLPGGACLGGCLLPGAVCLLRGYLLQGGAWSQEVVSSTH